MSASMTLVEAVRGALLAEMTRDESVILLGGDVTTSVSGFSAGLLDEFGERRVIDLPFAEATMVGAANGAAMAGLRPVVDLGNLGFSLTAMDQLTNEGPKVHYKFGGQLRVPAVFVFDYSARGWGPQHDQAVYALLGHMPGMKVVLPSSPATARSLLSAAVRDDNPVAFCVAHALKKVEGHVDGDETAEIGRAVVTRPGTDVSLFATGALVAMAEETATILGTRGVSAEVVDVTSLVPIDWATLEHSAAKTGLVVVCDQGHFTCGFAATIAARLQERLWSDLRGPVRTVTTLDVPVPYDLAMADRIVPTLAELISVTDDLVTSARPST